MNDKLYLKRIELKYNEKIFDIGLGSKLEIHNSDYIIISNLIRVVKNDYWKSSEFMNVYTVFDPVTISLSFKNRDELKVYTYEVCCNGFEIISEKLTMNENSSDESVNRSEVMFSLNHEDGTLPVIGPSISDEEAILIVDEFPEYLRSNQSPLGFKVIQCLKEVEEYLREAVIFSSDEDVFRFNTLLEVTEYTDTAFRLEKGKSLVYLRNTLPLLDLGVSRIGDNGEIFCNNQEMELKMHGSGFHRLCFIIPLLYKAALSKSLVVIDNISVSLHPILEEALLEAVSRSMKTNENHGQLLYGSRRTF